MRQLLNFWIIFPALFSLSEITSTRMERQANLATATALPGDVTRIARVPHQATTTIMSTAHPRITITLARRQVTRVRAITHTIWGHGISLPLTARYRIVPGLLRSNGCETTWQPIQAYAR